MKALLELLAARGSLLDAACAERLRSGSVDLGELEAAVRDAPALPLFLTEGDLVRLVRARPPAAAATTTALLRAGAAGDGPASPVASATTLVRPAPEAAGLAPAAPSRAPLPSATRAAASPGAPARPLAAAPAPAPPARATSLPPATPPAPAPAQGAAATATASSAPAALVPPARAPPPAASAPSPVVSASPLAATAASQASAPPPAALVRASVPAAPAPAPAPVPRRIVPAPAPAVPSSYAHDWRVLADITGQSTCEGDLTDFTRYFNDRLTRIKKMLRQRREMVGFVPIRQFRPGAMAEVKIVGIVNEVRTTKNGHRLLEIEDESGVCAVLAPASDAAAITEAETVVEDEVIGIVAKPASKGELLILQKLVRPEVPMERTPARSQHGSAVAFVSDLHFGSKTFLHEDWDRFVRWINGDHPDPRSRALAAKVRYLVVNGDVVDGVGIFPGQEDELEILDAYDQYRAAGEQVARIRSDVKVFVLPGNHDLVRPAEPQPTFPEKYTRLFPERTTFVGNPCRLALEGVEVLAYHGRSFDDWITRVPGLSYERPIDAMREMVARRHMAPIYGQRTPVAPEHKDHLVIDTVPDIFETGHVHAAGMETWRGITLINSSCWQSQTAYQKMHGFQPQPAIVPVVELDTGKGWMLDFHQGPSGVDRVGKSRFQPEKGVVPEL